MCVCIEVWKVTFFTHFLHLCPPGLWRWRYGAARAVWCPLRGGRRISPLHSPWAEYFEAENNRVSEKFWLNQLRAIVYVDRAQGLHACPREHALMLVPLVDTRVM